jgi:hypothetical protein
MEQINNGRNRNPISLLISALTLVLLSTLSVNSLNAQGVVSDNPATIQTAVPSRSYNEAFFRVGTLGTSFGINHFKDLTPRTAIVIGASYSNYRMGGFYSDYYRYLPASSTNVYGEFRYYLLPKENQLTAFTYAAVNTGYNQFMNGRKVNLGLEVGGEMRYKISENASISVRTSFYRQNGSNPYMMNPYMINPSYPMR